MADVKAAAPTLPTPGSERVDLQFNTATENTSLLQSVAMSSQAAGPNGLAVLGKRIRDNANVLFETRKPLSEFLDRSAMSKPTSIGEVTTRLQKNLSYYRTNYFIFFLATMCLTFLFHPSALIWTGLLLVMWTYLFLVASGPLTIGGREYSDREKLIGASVISFVVVFFLTSVATTALYGLSISMAMIVLHGAFREPDDLFLDEAGGTNNLFANNMFQGLQPFQQSTSGPAMV